jgi:hypothetical protein
MTITQQITPSQLIISYPYFQITVKSNKTYIEDGIEKDTVRDYVSYKPGDDVSSASADVQTVAAAIWTPAVVAAYEAYINPPATPPEA